MTEKNNNLLELYVDGSFVHGRTGYGLVVVKRGEEIYSEFGRVPAEYGTASRQVAGELYAVRQGLAWCKAQGLKTVIIYYDYLGIELWVTGRWQARQPLTQAYRDEVRHSGLTITWQKVNSHSGHRWNDRADELAKQGAASATRPNAMFAGGNNSPRFSLGDVAAGGGAQSFRAPQMKSSVVSGDFQTELIQWGRRIQELLATHGFQVEWRGVYNDNNVKMVLSRSGRSCGQLNLYHTRKKPFKISLHEIKIEAQGLLGEILHTGQG